MAFVYRYLTRARNVKYVGMVKGSKFEDLERRIKQHKNEEGFRGRAWSVEYIDGLTVTEAAVLESHFIAENLDTVINKAKLKDGAITFSISPVPMWKSFDDARKIYAMRDEPLPPEKIKYFYCSNCGQKSTSGVFVSFIMREYKIQKYYPMRGGYLCEDCAESLWQAAKPLLKKFAAHGMSYSPAEPMEDGTLFRPAPRDVEISHLQTPEV